MKKKVLLVSEFINPPYDEGIKKTVYNLYCDLEKRYEIQVICRYGFTKDNIFIVKSNPLFLDKSIRKKIINFKPDILIYFPFSSATFASNLRMKILSYYCISAKKILIALQPKPLKYFQKFLVRFIKPQIALTPSPELKEFWDTINIKSHLIPLFTDLSKFKPLQNQSQKILLRRKYNLPEEAYIISHIGHLNEGRNLESLIHLQRFGYQVIIVGSSSTPLDAVGSEDIRYNLEKEGIIIIDEYLENIEHIYQLSDLYIFPVVNNCSSIGMPLSILEARACGIPVVTTDFGSIKEYLQDDYGSIMYEYPEEFLNVVKKVKDSAIDYITTSVDKLNAICNEIIFSEIEK